MTLPEGITDLHIPTRDKSGWAKGIIRWRFEGRWHLSIPFTWLLPEAAAFCATHENCVVGGPAVRLMPEYIGQWAEVSEEWVPWVLQLHNPNATRTTRGCRNACPFCGTSRIDGGFEELGQWPALPIVIDPNILQASDPHFFGVIDRLRGVSAVDFNGGLEERYFSGARAEAIISLRPDRLQFSWDAPEDRNGVLAAIELARSLGQSASGITVRVLVNFREEPDEALDRMLTLRGLGVWPFPMRYQPLDCLRKNDYRAPQWSDRDLRYFTWFWSRQAWLGGADFRWPSEAQPPLFAGVPE